MSNTITIVAPESTNANGQIVTTLSGQTTGSVQLYASTNYKPGSITWSCTSPSGVTVLGTNGANPYYLSQALQFSHVLSGTSSLTVKANDATNGVSSTATISIVTHTITLSPANPIVAQGGAATFTATASYSGASFTWAAKNAAGGDVTSTVFPNGHTGTCVTGTFPSSSFAVNAQITITVTDSTNDASARSIVLLAPSDATDSNITLGYGANGSVYMASNAFTNGLPYANNTLATFSILPWPMQRILKDGVYAADISGASVSTICCYILNLKTFNTVFGL